MDLFDHAAQKPLPSAPLADRMRPETLDEFEGQEKAVGKGSVLRTAIERDDVPSLMLWGPPGTGKTTLARIIAKMTKSRFEPFSAVSGSVKDVRDIIKIAEDQRKYYQKKTILFVDEIHRFNKAQQDAFLPSVENGTITLIGATTENPSFEVNAALLSRSRVVVLEHLQPEAIARILKRALVDEVRGLGNQKISISEKAITALANLANGDARTALNTLEIAAKTAPKKKDSVIITEELVAKALARTHLMYDKGGEEHYNIISALHKSMRGSDADAALYWTARMLEAGEDPLYIARRLIRFASEDIGLADPQALVQAVTAYQACHMIGVPECNVTLAQCVVYMARAKKSNGLYVAYNRAKDDIMNLPNEPVPLHIRNAPTKLMKNLGYGKGYKYTPAFDNPEDAMQDYLPDSLKGKKYLP